jgi:hypothetical protein
MRRFIRVSAVVAVLLGSVAMAPSVALAIPVISGAYILSASSNCQAILNVTKNVEGQVISINISSGGAVNGIAGTITFTPETGEAAVSAISVDGSSLLMQGVTHTQVLRQSTTAETWPYSNTGTSFTLNGVVYRVVYGKLISNVPQQFNVVGREEASRCVFYGTFTKK